MTLTSLRRAALLCVLASSAGGSAQVTTPTAPAAPVSPDTPVTTTFSPPESTATPLPLGVVPAVPIPGQAMQGVWVDAFGPGLKTRAQVTQTVNDAVRLGFNTLFVQAIRRADCLCRKAGIPMVTDADLEKNFDPLEVVTKQAHARGLRVIAWVAVAGIANTTTPNSNPQHIYRTHGPNSGAASWMNRRADGTWQEGRDSWLDLGIPAAAEYLAQAVVNLVRNYPVDGVQLDRIRYPDDGVWGYDPKTLARYRAETGSTGTPSGDDPAWAEWKRTQVTNFVRRVALGVKGVRSSAWVTAATITYTTPPRVGDLNSFRHTRTYAEVLQDWPTWMNQGYLDLNVLMNYKRDAVDDQALWFDGWNAFARSVTPRADGLYAGVAGGSSMYVNAPTLVAAQATRTIKAGLGWVGYSYRTPTPDVFAQRQTTAQGLESIRAVLSGPGQPLGSTGPWTEGPPTVRGMLGRVTGTATPGYRVVEAWRDGQLLAQTYTDGSGYYGFLALTPGRVEVRVSGQRWVDTLPARGVLRLPDLLVRDLSPIPALPPAPQPLQPLPPQPVPPQQP